MTKLIEFDGKLIDASKQLIELERFDYENSLYAFLKGAWPYIDASPWRDGWPIEAVAEHLQAVVDGDIKRLLINIPPRHGKSSITSVAFPAWAWAQKYRSPISGPQVQFLMASYANQLVLRDSVKCRKLIESPWYQKYWGDRFTLNSDQNTKSRFSNDQNGERLITSVGAAVTGEGGSCLPAWSKISTPNGSRPISGLSEGDFVLAFDHSLGRVVEKPIIATQVKRSNRLYEIHTVSGHSFECTGDHPVFVSGTGYVVASELGVGDRVVVERWQKNNSAPDMRPVRNRRGEVSVRSPKGLEAGKSGRLLLEKMLFRASCSEKYKKLCRMRGTAQAQAFRGLFRRLCGKNALGQAKEAVMSALHEAICGLDNVLHSGMRGCGAFHSYAWEPQLQLHAPRQILQSIQGNEANRSGEGWPSLPSLWGGGSKEQIWQDTSAGPSHRRKQPEQRPGESDCLVRELPQASSSWENDVISRIEVHSGAEIPVYDIQVEGCRNFFAEGVLVHNCIIVDDPNAANEAFSEANIQSTIDWWDGTMSTRLNDQKTGAMIVIQQRLAENDLTGHILETDTKGEWTHLCLPMRYEWRRHSSTVIGWEDPRGCDDDDEPLVTVTDTGERVPIDNDADKELAKREGTLLWPDRFGDEEVERLERALGPYGSAGQLQQRPEPAGGGVIKLDWWNMWEESVYPPMDFIIASLDTAYTLNTANDYSALSVWGVFSGSAQNRATRTFAKDGTSLDRFSMHNDGSPKVMLMHAWQKRLEFHELTTEVANTCKRMKVDKLLIENKAAGISVSQELRRLYSGSRWAVQLSDPKSMDKLSRLYSIQHIFSEGMVFAPDFTWSQEVITQVGQFPKGKHDDLVDTVSMAIRHLRDLGMLERASERQESEKSAMGYPGSDPAPLYSV